MFSLALTAFVTGVTEPIEFTFMFIAPVLYAIHAVLTGVSMALTWALGMQDGFGFSAGAVDYASTSASRPSRGGSPGRPRASRRSTTWSSGSRSPSSTFLPRAVSPTRNWPRTLKAESK